MFYIKYNYYTLKELSLLLRYDIIILKLTYLNVHYQRNAHTIGKKG